MTDSQHSAEKAQASFVDERGTDFQHVTTSLSRADVAQQVIAAHQHEGPITPEEERRLVRKLDLVLIPISRFLHVSSGH